jgi:uncharacterized membrane protein
MVRSRVSSLLLPSVVGGLVVVALFRLLSHLDSHGASGHFAGPNATLFEGIDRIGEAQLFLLMWMVCMVLVLAAVLGALERERAGSTGHHAETGDPAVDHASAAWHHRELRERG